MTELSESLVWSLCALVCVCAHVDCLYFDIILIEQSVLRLGKWLGGVCSWNEEET